MASENNPDGSGGVNRSIPDWVKLYDLDVTQMPRPFFVLRLPSEKIANKAIQSKTILAKRRLSKEEAAATAYYGAKEWQLFSYGIPVGGGLGLYRSWKTADTYKYPFVRVKPEFNPNSFKLPFTGIRLQGLSAQTAHYAMSRALYLSAGIFLGLFISASFAGSYTVSSERRDPVLKPLVKEIQERLWTEFLQRREAREQERARRAGNQDRQGSETATNTPRKMIPEAQRKDPFYDDASPTDGQTVNDYRSDSIYDTNTVKNASGFGDSFPPRTPDARTVTRGTYSAQHQSSESRDSSLDFWSSSEFPSSDQNEAQRTTQPSRPRWASNQTRDRQARTYESGQADNPFGGASEGGSAWDRIRQNAAGGQPSSGSGSPSRDRRGWMDRQGERTSGGESFSYSGSEAERQLAKDEAQREFDAKVERERQGGDFNDGVGGSSTSRRGGSRW